MKVELAVRTSSSYDDTVAELVTQGVAGKLAAQDPTLWGASAEPEASIRLVLGVAGEDLPPPARGDRRPACRPVVRGTGPRRAVWDGRLLAGTRGHLAHLRHSLTILDSTDPSVVHRAISGDLSRTVVVVSTKSGWHPRDRQPASSPRGSHGEAGIDAPSRIVVVTDPGSPLEELARERRLSQGRSCADPHVGGRYSALTAFGLVPTRARRRRHRRRCLTRRRTSWAGSPPTLADNPALLLAAALAGNRAARQGRHRRLGFRHHGVRRLGRSSSSPSRPASLATASCPSRSKGPTHRRFAGPRRTSWWPPWSLPTPCPTATRPPGARFPSTRQPAPQGRPGSATAVLGEPWVTVSGSLGAQFLTWETATAVMGRMLGINPFDQPDVESRQEGGDGGCSTASRRTEPAQIVESGIEVRGSGACWTGSRPSPALSSRSSAGSPAMATSR